MTSVTVIAVGNLKEGYLREGIAEYRKRISAYADCEIVELREERIANEDHAAEIAGALNREADKILAAVPKGAYTVALCVEGKSLDSEGLARLTADAVDRSGKICFVIGSSHGLSSRVKQAADFRLSYSALTLPHQLMRLLLLESIYRSLTIMAGKRYHK